MPVAPPDEFTDADFAAPSTDEFTEADFQQRSALPKVTPSIYETQRQSGPMGPFGPLNPEEVLHLPDVLKVPAAILEKADIIPKIQEAIGTSMRSLGIDPAVITPTPPGPTSVVSPTPMEQAFPNFMRGLNLSADQMAAGLADPTLAPLLLAKPAQALFGAQALSAVPGGVEQMAKSQSAEQLGATTGETLANLGIGMSIAGHLLPRASELAKETLTEKGVPDASSQQEAATVHGDVRTQQEPASPLPKQEGGAGVQPQATAVAKEAQVPLKLSSAEEDYLNNASSDLDVPVQVVEKPLESNEPFAGQIATVDRQTGQILVNPREFSLWLKNVPEEQRPLAVKSMLAEERIHLAVDDASALDYWNNLTSLEKAINSRRYSGRWSTSESGFTELQLGHEALRFRLQQLSRLTPREIAEAAGREKWTVKSITALESAVRGLREKFATKASLQQLEILDRMQENLDAAKAVASGQPGAYRKPRREENELLLPGMKQTAGKGVLSKPETEPALSQPSLEERTFQQPTPALIDAMAQDALSKPEPSFQDFLTEAKMAFGSRIKPEQIYYSWTDTLSKKLMGMPGAELEKLMDSLGLRPDVAKGLKPQEAEPFLSRGLPDPEQAVGEAGVPPGELFPTARGKKAYVNPKMKARYAAIGAIMDELSKEAGEKPSKPWSRKEISPEDVTQRYVVNQAVSPEVAADPDRLSQEGQWDVATDRQFRTLKPEEAKNPQLVAQMATAGGAIDRTGKGAPPETVTRNVIVLRNNSTGELVGVSAFKAKQVPRVTNPVNAEYASRQIDAQLLKDWTPAVVMTLREPVKDFRQVWPNQEAFSKYWGDLAIEGTPGIRTGMFAGPQAGVIETQAGIRGAGTPPPEQAGLPPEFTEADFQSPTAQELTTPQRGAIPTGRALYRSPRPGPEPAEKLPFAGRLEAEARARAEHPYEPTRFQPSAELEKRGISIMPGARGERPAAFRKQQGKDLVDAVSEAFKNMVTRADVRGDIYKLRDAADHKADMLVNEAKTAIIAASEKQLPSLVMGRKEARRTVVEEAKKAREAAMAYIATGGDKKILVKLDEALDRAETRARMWESDTNPLRSREGKKDQVYIAKLREGLKYAEDHWTDPEFQATAKKASEELKNIRELEEAAGKTTVNRENYDPSVFEGDYWNTDMIGFPGRKLLGEQYRMPKTYRNAYDAIAGGPYRLASLDVADRVAHRLHQGFRWIENETFFDSLKAMRDRAAMKVVAKDAKPIFREQTDPVTGDKYRELAGYASPEPGYEVLRGKKIAVLSGYKRAVDWATAPSAIDQFGLFNIPVGRTAIIYGQLLKHNVLLLLDSFHMGRLVQYATALTGIGKVGFRAGKNALMYRPEDLQKAVDSGAISQDSANWVKEKVTVNTGRPGFTRQMSHKDILQAGIMEGLNAKRFSDALYKEAANQIPGFGPIYARTLGKFNNFMFDDLIPGLMAESFVRSFEKLNTAHPNIPYRKLMRDVARDMNIFYGNMGRQGIFKTKTMGDFARLFLLAPMWQEGLVQKEIRGFTRLAASIPRAAGIDLPYRKGLPPLGALGGGFGKGLLSYFVGTQIANLITRHHLTFNNPEPEHKLDAWIPTDSKGGGFWLSPLSTFAEITHDVIRLMETKPRGWDAIEQIGANRASPIGKLLLIAATGTSPRGQYYSTTPGVMWGAASQVVPFAGASPISLSIPARQLGHALLPSKISPNQPGQFARWTMASGAGIKVQTPSSAIGEVQRIAKRFVMANGLDKTTGWREQQTDEPNYSKLRMAISAGDAPQAKKMLQAIRQNHTDDQIVKAMANWVRRPWTGSRNGDVQMMYQISDAQKEFVSKANEERLELLQKFYDLLYE